MNASFSILFAALTSYETRNLIAGLASLVVILLAAYVFRKRREYERLRERRERLIKEMSGPIDQDPNYGKLNEIEKKLESDFNMATKLCIGFINREGIFWFGFLLLWVILFLWLCIDSALK